MDLEPQAKRLLGVLAVVGGAGAIVGGIFMFLRNRESVLRQTDFKASAAKKLRGAVTTSAGTTRVFQGEIPIRERLAIIQEMVAKSVKDPATIKLARQIVKECPDRDRVCELRKIYDFKKQNIRYTSDPAPHKLSQEDGGEVDAVDLFQTARQTVEMGGGDCDDHSILGSALGIINGIPMKLEVYAPFSSLKENYEHIAEAGEVDGRWVSIDSTVPGDFFNIEPPAAKKLGVDAIA